MGEAVERLSGKLGVDTTDFKTNIAAANRELKVLESGFRANAAALGDWTKDATGLESRIKSLTDQIDIQKLKVAALRENYLEMVAANGEGSRAAQDAEIKLNKETEQLNKMERELKGTEQALQDLGSAEQDAGEEAEEAGGKMNTFGSIVSGMGGIVRGAITVVAGLAVAVAGITAAIGGLVFSTASTSAELVDLSAQTGISTTRLQELAFVGNQVGTSQETMTGSMARLVRSMATATDQTGDFNQKLQEQNQRISDAQTAYDEAAAKYGKSSDKAQSALEKLNDEQERLSELSSGDVAKAFESLGVSVTDSTGKLRDNEAVFADVIDALGKIDNEAERDALAMALFGKSAQELNPLIKAGSEEMARLSEESHNVGEVMSEEDVAAFEAFDDTLASLQGGLKGTLGTLAGAFLPGFQSIFNQAGGYLQQFSEIVRGADGDIGQIATGLGGLITQIVTDIASQAPQLLQTGVTILQSIVTAILTALPTLIPAAVNVILTLLQFLIDNLPLLIDAGVKAIVALVTGIANALPTLIPAVVQAIITIVNTLVDNLPLIINAALQLILGLAQGLIQALPVLIAALPQIIAAIINALIDALPMIFDAAGQLIGMLATGIVNSIPVLLVAVGQLIAELGNSLANFVLKIPEIGRKFVQGLANGVKSAKGMLYEAVTGLVNGMLDRIKGILGIHSPSAVGEGFGENFVNAVGGGGKKAAPAAQQQMAQAVSSLTQGLSLALSSGLGGGPQLATARAGISIGDIYVDARGATDPKAVGQSVSDSLIKALRSLGGA